ncbi:uncharacterized protein C3orf62-like isoform X2 [Salminus brasiliensis]
MSAQLRQCRKGLVAALDQATQDTPEDEYCSPASPSISEPVIYVSPQFLNGHPNILHDCSLGLMSYNVMFRHSDRADCRCTGQGSRQKSEADVSQDWPGVLETSSMQTLEELVAKLEFENELNRVCSKLRPTMDTESPPTLGRGHSTGSADSGVEEVDGEGDAEGEEDEHTGLLDTVLEMEQDYDLHY